MTEPAQLLQQVVFIFFSKDNKANLSSLVGYYAEVVMKNESTSKAELYQVGSDISESSKS